MNSKEKFVLAYLEESLAALLMDTMTKQQTISNPLVISSDDSGARFLIFHVILNNFGNRVLRLIRMK
jgi:hypothetical protein